MSHSQSTSSASSGSFNSSQNMSGSSSTSSVAISQPTPRSSLIENIDTASTNASSSSKEEKPTLNATGIQSILKDIEGYKKTTGSERQVVMEMLGFALALSRALNNDADRRTIETKIIAEIEAFIFRDISGRRGVALANLPKHIDGYKEAIRGIQLKV